MPVSRSISPATQADAPFGLFAFAAFLQDRLEVLPPLIDVFPRLFAQPLQPRWRALDVELIAALKTRLAIVMSRKPHAPLRGIDWRRVTLRRSICDLGSCFSTRVS